MSLRHRLATRPPGWLAALALATLWSPGATQAQDAPASPTACALHWQVQVQEDGPLRSLRLTLRFDANGRQRTHLRLPGGWPAYEEFGIASTSAGASPRLQPVADDPRLRRVQHGPQDRVQLQWQVQVPADTSPVPGLMGGAGWFAFTGAALLPLPDEADERTPPLACVSLTGSDPGSQRWLSSHGAVDGGTALWRLPAAGGALRSQVQQAVYAGGHWQSTTQRVEGQALTVARPDQAEGPGGADPAGGLALLSQAGIKALAAHRRHWAETLPAAPLMLWLLPSPSAAGSQPQAVGSAWHQAMVVQVTGAAALPPSALDAAVTQALNRLWLLDRFGPLVQAGRDDEPLRRWFSEGVADFLAHQALLRDGRWQAADLAAELNRQIDRWALPDPGAVGPGTQALDAAARGEWLALHWHQQLRAQGQAGLDALMRRLWLPAAQARREGPISAPLATHRLVAALRARLGDTPLRDVQRVVDRAEPVPVYADTLSACFGTQRAATAPGQFRVQARDGALQQAACQGWLGIGPEALRPGVRPRDSDALGGLAATPQTSVPAGQSIKHSGKLPGKASARGTKRSGGKSASGGQDKASKASKAAAKRMNKRPHQR